MKKLLALLLVLILVAGLVACGGGNQPPTPTPVAPADPSEPTDTDDPGEPDPIEIGRQTLRIGIATAFTGPGARGAETQLLGLQVALQHIEEDNFSRYFDFELFIGDDHGDAMEAVNAANRLVHQDNVHAMFGHLNAVVTLAGIPVYEEAHVPLFTPSGSARAIIDSGFEYVYMVVPSDSIVMATLASYLVNDLGIERIGVLFSNNEQGQSALAFVQAGLAPYGMEVAASEAYMVGDVDFTAQMLNFRSADVETVLIVGGDIVQRSIMVQQARQLIDPDILISGDANFANVTFINTTEPEERDGIIFAAAWSNADTDAMSLRYIEDFMALDPQGARPGAVTVRFYDGMFLLATALNNLGPYDINAPTFQQSLNAAIRAAHFEGLQGMLDPQPNGETLLRAFIVRYTLTGEEVLS